MNLTLITEFLEGWAPLSIQESYDNSGLLTGRPGMEVSGALLSLDCTEAVLDEAIAQGINLIICHHPPVFTGMKRFNGSNATERILIKAIRHDLAIYACHTNLDHAAGGVSSFIADKLGLVNKKVMQPLKGKLKKLVCYCPPSHSVQVLDALFGAGAGSIENYSNVSFQTTGTQTFMPVQGANPYSGTIGQLHTGEEVKLECVCTSWLENKIIKAMKDSHPYEVVAYDLIPLENELADYGAGIEGEFEEPMEVPDFLALVAGRMKADCIRHTAFDRPIKKVGCCGGSGSFLLQAAISAGCDAFITADFKYHQFFDAEQQILIADIGHFESEQYTPELLYSRLSEKFPNFALLLSRVHTNPIYYYNGNNC